MALDAKAQMAAKKENEIWLYSYADLITNLLAFFIMMLVMNKGGPGTQQKIQESLAKVVGKTTPVQDLNNAVSQALDDAKVQNKVAVEKTIDGVSLTFSGGFFFETSSAELTVEARDVLAKVIPVFKKLKPGTRIDVEGHADSRPIQKSDMYPSNWELSAARAGSVVRYLGEQGVDARKMRAIGYSDTHPISNEDLRMNRRVVITIGSGVR